MFTMRRPSPQTATVLRALHERGPEWSHGYELCRALGLKAGTLYPILIRLADRNLVETAWEQEVPQGRPARHLYRLSTTGATFAATLPRPVGSDPTSPFTARPVLGEAGA
ncbi:PadR family transcriptional regulator [Microcella pacifica]|uniref:PadR family transcriptional regulator n=1 Tax=Microcella pacifica TaxID=2591847 RepID=A0A9E5JLV1_9MICO|nr:helix-turn-helix transcriptional regulator [Microcella pacifica]NHF61845.1 PadR family transcriptional regulator [Microcella pacifica]